MKPSDEAKKQGDEVHRFNFSAVLTLNCFIATHLFKENHCLMLYCRQLFKEIHCLTLHCRYFLRFIAVFNRKDPQQ
jgi:hypothetical protein